MIKIETNFTIYIFSFSLTWNFVKLPLNKHFSNQK